MPISSPSSYLPTADEFIAHWTGANAELGAAGPILLAGGMSLASFTALRGTLQTQRAQVESARNGLEGSRGDLEATKTALLARLNQFNAKVRSLSPGTRWEPLLPKAFNVSEGMGRVIRPLDDLADVWTRYDADVAPVTLPGGYFIDDFTDQLAALKLLYTATSSAAVALRLARGKRNETQEKIHEVLRQYRSRIPAEFLPGSAIFETLPRLSPLPGSTPDPVQLAGSYHVPTQQALLTWDAPADPSVVKLEVRGNVGPEFEAEDEILLATVLPAGPHTWTGPLGLDTPGTAVSFKVFTLTAEGNQRGSNEVTITRPAA